MVLTSSYTKILHFDCLEFFEKPFVTDFIPHGHCYFWRPETLWPHVLGDAFAAVPYFVIPVVLYRFVQARPDIKYPNIFSAFALFILLCGLALPFYVDCQLAR